MFLHRTKLCFIYNYFAYSIKKKKKHYQKIQCGKNYSNIGHNTLYHCLSQQHLKAIYLTVVVSQDPGEDRVLHQVIVGSARQCIQVHQILEVADLSSLRMKKCSILVIQSDQKFIKMSQSSLMSSETSTRLIPRRIERLTSHRCVTDFSPTKVLRRPDLDKTTQIR